MILCCGEALIDMIPASTTSGTEGFVPHCGGAVFNTAIALGKLGAQVGMLTGISSDMFGTRLAGALEASRVDTAHVIKSDRPTTLAFVQLNKGQATYDFFDENSAGRMLTPADMPVHLLGISALFLGGISLACEPCADAYAALLGNHGADRAVMIDPNIRAAFVTDEPRYRARLKGMIAQTDILKISDEDLDWLVPGPSSSEHKLSDLRTAGPAVILLTQGAKGATGYLADGSEVSVPAQSVEVIDTVGAGDTFNAGVLAALHQAGHLTKDGLRTLRPDDLRNALTIGIRAAAITVSRAGANPPWTHEL